MKLEISEPARALIRRAWQHGLVLVVSAPWHDYDWSYSLYAVWRRLGDEVGLRGCIRVGDGDWVYLRADLLPALRDRSLRLEGHSLLGMWPGVAVRDVDPAPILAGSDGLWPRIPSSNE